MENNNEKSKELIIEKGVNLEEYKENKEIKDDYDRSLSVKCYNGTFVGLKNGNVISYKGIPYAQPPVDKLRFKPSLKALKSDKIYEAYYFGKSSLQSKCDTEKGSLYEQSENQCEIVKEGNISIFICNKNEIDITKFEKIYLYYNNNKTNPIILNPKNYFEIINDKYICKIVQNKNINNIILGIPAFLDNTFIFDLKENMIKIKEHKENYMAYIIIIGIIALLLIIIPILIYIYENNKKEKNFNKLDDISNTNNLIEKNYSN